MSIFLKMSKVIDQELIAGRITVDVAKTMLAVNRDIATNLELRYNRRLRSNMRYTEIDWERDKFLDETFYSWQTR
jgi:hypothetical protein